MYNVEVKNRSKNINIGLPVYVFLIVGATRREIPRKHWSDLLRQNTEHFINQSINQYSCIRFAAINIVSIQRLLSENEKACTAKQPCFPNTRKFSSNVTVMEVRRNYYTGGCSVQLGQQSGNYEMTSFWQMERRRE